MDKETLFSLLDKEKFVQGKLYDYSVDTLKDILSYLSDVAKENNKKKITEIITKSEATPEKPLSDFILSILPFLSKTDNSSKLVNLIQNSIKTQNYNYVLLLVDLLLSVNPHDSFASATRIKALQKTDAPKEELKYELTRFTMHDDKDVSMLLYLSDILSEEGNEDDSILAVKRALNRAIKNKNTKEIETVINKLIKKQNIDLHNIVSYFETPNGHALGGKIEGATSELYKAVVKNNDAVLKLRILKLILKNSTNIKFRNDIVDAYRTIYSTSTRLEECLNESGLLSSVVTDYNKAISNFEKDILIDKGTFVYHKGHGIGRVTNIEEKNIYIDFVNKRNHKMSTNMALSSLAILEKNHIWVLKQFVSKEKLANKFKTDPRWGVVTLLKSGDDTVKLMKKEIVPSVLSESEWNTFLQSAKKILKNDDYITSDSTSTDRYVLLAYPITAEEKIYSAFKQENSLIEKIKLVRIAISQNISPESEVFLSMMKYFGMQLSVPNITTDYLISHLFLSSLANSRSKIKEAEAYIKLTNESVYENLNKDKIKDHFSEIDDADLKKEFVDLIKDVNKDGYKEVLTECFITSPNALLEKILSKDNEDFIKEMMMKSMFIVKQNPTLFIYLLKNNQDLKLWEASGISQYDIILACINIINTYSSQDKGKTMSGYLFDEKKIYSFIDNCSDELILNNLDKIISFSTGIEESKSQEARHYIKEKLGDKSNDENKEIKAKLSLLPKELLCLASSYDKKKAELDDIINVQIPQNAKEIGEARELGDLRENSEFQYAKDKQRLLNNTMKKLDEEILKAKVVRKESFDSSSVGFGTVVTIKDENENTTFTYTVLGPWESKPEENIISYLAPAIKEIYGAKKGDTVEFSLNDVSNKWTILDIKKLEI